MKKLCVLFIICVMLSACALLSACSKDKPEETVSGSETATSSSDAAPITQDDWELEDGELPAPKFSVPSGIYDDPFILEIASWNDLTIRYTLDGSEPNASSPEYTAPIEIKNRTDEPNVLAAHPYDEFAPSWKQEPGNVTKCTVIRAACFDDNTGEMSDIATSSYLVGIKPYGVKVISLSLDESSLFDYEKGIYVLGKSYDDWLANDPKAKTANEWEIIGNFSQRGREWERPVHADIIGTDGTLLCGQDLGIRIMGTATRTYYQKNFRLIARKEYGKKNIKCSLIDGLTRERDGQPLEKYKSVILRNGGNDNENILFRDPYIQRLVENCNLSTQGSEPAVVFIDGEYWGLYTITEDYSNDNIEDNYDIDKKNVVMVKVGKLEEGEPEDIKLYDDFMKKASKANFKKQDSYDWICDTIDIDNFIDYSIVNIYTYNQDGVFGDYDGNNWMIWRTRESVDDNEYGDCRWRFMLFGTEYALGLYCDEPDVLKQKFTEYDNLAEILKKPKVSFTGLFIKLLENDDFKQRFITRFMDLRNDVFVPENSVGLLQEMKKQYYPLMDEQITRNGPYWAVYYGSNENFFNAYYSSVKRFMTGRYSFSETMLRNNFKLGEAYALTVSSDDPAGGSVTVNTLTPDLSVGEWSGSYFTDYPVTVTAVPSEGYSFTGWKETGDKSETVSLNLKTDTALTACFEKE